MNPRERVVMTLEHEEPDRVPIDLSGTQGSGIHVVAYRNLANRIGMDPNCGLLDMALQLAAPSEDMLRSFNSDFRAVCMRPKKGFEIHEFLDETGRQCFVDEWGIRWGKSRYYYDMMENPLKEPTLDALERFPWPDPYESGRTEGLAEQVKRLYKKTDFAIVAGIAGPTAAGFFEQAWAMRGFPKFLADLLARPEFVDALLDRLLETYLDFYEMYLDIVGEYVQLVEWGDDYGMQIAPLISPTLFRRYFKDRNKKFFDLVKSKTDAKIFFHSCGSIYPFIEDLIEVGVDVLNPIQPLAANMDHVRLKKEFGSRLSFHGGLDIQRLLPRGTPKEVEDGVRRLLTNMASGGGYLFAAAHNIQADVPPENVLSMFEAASKYGKYKL